MKNVITLAITLFTALFLPSVLYSQPPIFPTIAAYTHAEDSNDTPKSNCLDLEIGSNTNGVINLDCINDVFFWTKVKSNNCGCENFVLNINGIRIKQLSNDELQLFKLAGDDIKHIFKNDQTGVFPFTIRVDCPNYQGLPGIFYAPNSGYSTLTVNVVRDGMEYDRQIGRVPSTVLYEFVPTSISDVPTTCCNANSGISISNAKSKVTKSSGSQEFNFELTGDVKVGFDPLKPFRMSNLFKFSFQNVIFQSSNQIRNISKSFDLPSAEFGCLKVGYQIYGDVLIYQKYKANCNGSELPVGTAYEVAVPKVILYKGFPTSALPPSACKAITPLIEQRYSVISRRLCTGTLDLSLDQNEVYFITWVDEIGNFIPHLNGDLISVPNGKYTVTISNKCCDVFTKSYYVCSQTTYGNYSRSTNETWCRSVYCSDAGCSETYDECVTPDNIEETFNPFSLQCIKEYYYLGEKIGEETTTAQTETKYDEFWDRCETKYFCNGSEVFEDRYYPEDSEWEYDNFWEECRLNVTCKGIYFENVEVVDPVISWDWDEFFEECVSTYIACDGEGINESISSNPYYIGGWRWESSGSNCVRSIICESGGQVFEEWTSATYQRVGASSDCPDGLIRYNVLCDGDLVDYDCLSNLQDPQIKSRIVHINNMVSLKVKNDELMVKIKSTVEAHVYSLMIYDMIGRVQISKEIIKTDHDISLKIDGITSGMYIASILQDRRIIHAEKIIINN